jgi:hypothetical protein
MHCQSVQLSFEPYYLSCDDEEHVTPENFAEMIPGPINHAAHAARLLTAARLHLNSPPESPQNWGQVNPNLDDYHSDLI